MLHSPQQSRPCLTAKRRRHSALGLTVMACPLLASLLTLTPAQAQDGGGGVSLTFGLSQRLEVSNNTNLAVVSSGTSSGQTFRATTGLSFGAVSETRDSRLAFQTSASLRAGSGNSDSGFDLTAPQASLSYSRTAANASFNLGASLRQDEIAGLDSADVGTDVTDLTGTGTRRSYSVSAGLTLAEGAPLSFGLSAAIGGTSYIDASDPALADTQRRSVGITAQLRLSETISANIGLSYALFETDKPGSVVRKTTGLSAGVAIARPNGTLNLSLGADQTADGTRTSLTLGRDYVLPRGSLSGSIGATRGVNGSTRVSANLAYHEDLPNGALDASLKRSLGAGSDDSERLITALSLGYSRELTPRSSLRLDANYAENSNLQAGLTTSTARLGASYNYALTEDWGLNMGYSHRLRDQDGVGRADSDTLFVGISRSFEFKP